MKSGAHRALAPALTLVAITASGMCGASARFAVMCIGQTPPRRPLPFGCKT